MTSLLGRLLPLFTGPRRVEDLFTEAVARLFERRPELCLSWLDDLDLTTPVSGKDQRYIRVTTQKSFDLRHLESRLGVAYSGSRNE